MMRFPDSLLHHPKHSSRIQSAWCRNKHVFVVCIKMEKISRRKETKCVKMPFWVRFIWSWLPNGMTMYSWKWHLPIRQNCPKYFLKPLAPPKIARNRHKHFGPNATFRVWFNRWISFVKQNLAAQSLCGSMRPFSSTDQHKLLNYVKLCIMRQPKWNMTLSTESIWKAECAIRLPLEFVVPDTEQTIHFSVALVQTGNIIEMKNIKWHRYQNKKNARIRRQYSKSIPLASRFENGND